MNNSTKVIFLALLVISCAVQCQAGFSGFYSSRAITRKPQAPTALPEPGTTQRSASEQARLDWFERNNQDRIKICHALSVVFRRTAFCQKHLKHIPNLKIRFFN